jgi:hypothetical protein
MDDATRTIEIERTINTQFENTELTGELHEIHRDLKGGVRDVRCDTVPLASTLDSCTELKLQVEANLRTYDSLGIDGSELGRPALEGLSSFTTCVEETIAKGQLLDDVMAQMVAIERSATTRTLTSISRAIDEQQRLTRLIAESLVLQREILLLLSDVFERFKAICTAVLELHIYCTALVEQRWASVLEQADAAHAAGPKEAQTDIQQSPNVSHTDEVVTADDSSAVQRGEAPCDAESSDASAGFDAGEVMHNTAADLHPFKTHIHPCKTLIVMVSENLRLYSVGWSLCGGSSNDLEVLHEGSTADEWPRWCGTEMADLHGSNGTTVRPNFSIILRHATSMARINDGAVRGLIAQLGLGRKRAMSARAQQHSGCKTAVTATAKHCLYPSGQPRLASEGAEAAAADFLMRRTLEFVKRLRRERAVLAQTQQS